MVLVPPVLLELSSTGYRFVKYDSGAPAYRRKEPPQPLLLELHRGGFIAWFTVMVVHVLAHLGDAAVSHPRDWCWRTRSHLCRVFPSEV